MNDSTIKDKIKNLLKGQQLSVISTIDNTKNQPESAVMAFAERDDLSLIFSTSSKTRKYKNLQTNKKISMVIGWSKETGSVQYEGIARELSDVEALKYGELLALKGKQTTKFVRLEDQKCFLVTPTWIRLIDISPETRVIYEITH